MNEPAGLWIPRRIAVLRALMLGDMVCATPALRALRLGWPQAHITLAGLPWAAAWARRLPWVDDFEAVPGWPGLPETGAPTQQAMRAFEARMQARQLDLALQLHGAGEVTNALVARWGARHNGGFHPAGTEAPAGETAHFVPWPQEGHEIERLLALTDGLGLPRRGLQTNWSITSEDRHRARSLLGFAGHFAVVHPGSQLPSRRWPLERFVQVANWLAAQGMRVVVTGTATERELARTVASSITRGTVVELAGRTDLWTLGGLLAEARLLVSNDTGPSHLAAALGIPSVVVACGGDVSRWAPLDTTRHRVLWQALPCRPCAHQQCPTGHECAHAVTVDDMVLAVQAALAAPASTRKEPQHARSFG